MLKNLKKRATKPHFIPNINLIPYPNLKPYLIPNSNPITNPYKLNFFISL